MKQEQQGVDGLAWKDVKPVAAQQQQQQQQQAQPAADDGLAWEDVKPEAQQQQQQQQAQQGQPPGAGKEAEEDMWEDI